MESPPTPRPVQPDEGINIPSGAISIDLDLNPDLEGDEANDMNNFNASETGELTSEKFLDLHSSKEIWVIEEVNSKANSEVNSGVNNKVNIGPERSEERPEERGQSQPASSINNPNLSHKSSPKTAVSQWTLPFEDAFQALKSQFNEGARHHPMSLTQQSKFINYVDAELLQIQRKFIKNQSDSVVTYTPDQLIQDLSPILDLLWFSLLDHESLFGQEEYYIKIMGDLDDWFTYYTLPKLSSEQGESINFHVRFFNIFQKLDTSISFLIDGYDANGCFSKMSATEKVRLSPIVMRLRMIILDKFGPSRSILGDNDLLNVLDIEIGRLFEGILDRL